MPRFRDIPQFTQHTGYAVDVSWSSIERQLQSMDDPKGVLDLDPDFQRAHVWDEIKRIRYVEYVLRGGHTSNNLYFNCASWNAGGSARGVKWEDKVELVDGKQRLEAVRAFMRDEIRAFGSLRSEYSDSPDLIRSRFRFNINDLKTRAQVLQWYLDLNDGGVVHTSDELEKVRVLLAAEKAGS